MRYVVVLSEPGLASSRQRVVTQALLDALALVMVDDQEKITGSRFREFLENNEFGRALSALSTVVNDGSFDAR